MATNKLVFREEKIKQPQCFPLIRRYPFVFLPSEVKVCARFLFQCCNSSTVSRSVHTFFWAHKTQDNVNSTGWCDPKLDCQIECLTTKNSNDQKTNLLVYKEATLLLRPDRSKDATCSPSLTFAGIRVIGAAILQPQAVLVAEAHPRTFARINVVHAGSARLARHVFACTAQLLLPATSLGRVDQNDRDQSSNDCCSMNCHRRGHSEGKRLGTWNVFLHVSSLVCVREIRAPWNEWLTTNPAIVAWTRLKPKNILSTDLVRSLLWNSMRGWW